MKTDRKQQVQKISSLYKKIQLVHEIQTIYFGNLNHSYQKQSYGILQSIDFHTYIGGFKSNKAEGLGLVIFPTGQIIYGNFQRDQLNGIAVIDQKGSKLKCGVFEKMEMVGIGFQYSYETKLWKMCKFYKGVAVQVIKQQLEVRQGVAPKIMHFQQNIYNLLNNYFNKKYFPVSVYQEQPELKVNTTAINKPVIITSHIITERFYHQISVSQQFYGYKDSEGYFGPGVLIQNDRIKAIGFFEGSNINGYGIKYGINDTVQLGLFINGKKQGLFLQKSGKKQIFVQYQQQQQPQQKSQINLDTIKKKQKKYNFQCKDFLSSKQTFNFEQLQQLFIPAEVRAFQDSHKQRDSVSPSLALLTHKQIVNSPNKPQKLSKSPKNPKKQQKAYYLIQKQQKSSVQIIRQKILTFSNVIQQKEGSAKSVKWKQDTKRSFKSKSPVRDEQQSQDQSIAYQENPFFA